MAYSRADGLGMPSVRQSGMDAYIGVILTGVGLQENALIYRRILCPPFLSFCVDADL